MNSERDNACGDVSLFPLLVLRSPLCNFRALLLPCPLCCLKRRYSSATVYNMLTGVNMLEHVRTVRPTHQPCVFPFHDVMSMQCKKTITCPLHGGLLQS